MDAFSLLSGRIKSLRLSKGAKIVCLVGRIWVTADGDLRDYVLGPGESYVAPGKVLAVIEDISGREAGSSFGVASELPELQYRPDFYRA